MNLRRIGRYLHLRFIRMRSTPSEISRGLALGVLAGMTPLLGFHMILALVLALLFKGNKLMALIGSWVGNPVTMPVILVLEYKIGRWIMASGSAPVPQFSLSLMDILHRSWNFLAPLFLGSFLLGALVALATYIGAVPLVRILQIRSKKRKIRSAS